MSPTPAADVVVATPEVLFSLPLPLVAAILLLLGALIGAGGWRLTRRPVSDRPVSFHAGVSWLSSVSQVLPCGVVLIDAHGQVGLANRTARSWIGEVDCLANLPPGIQTVVDRAVDSGLSEGVAVNATSGVDCPSTNSGHHRFWIEAATLGDSGDVLIVIRESNAGGVDAAVYRRLMQTIGHELRTPLTAIIGHADILSSCGIEEKVLWRRSQRFISSEAERLARLVDDLLTLSRLDRPVSSLTPVNLRAVAEEAISAMWQPAEDAGVTLALQTAERLPRVRGDADRLRQVFVNLLDNSIKYTPTGGRVAVQLTPEGECVHVEVNDTGMGIPEADLPHIFDPLFRSDQAVQIAPGTGLGLTIVHTILAQHGAEIQVQSQPKQGTTFSFDLHTAV